MPILHMETDIVRGVGNQLQQTADLLSEHTQQFNTTIQTLSSHWQGPSAEIFISDIHPILHQLNQLFDTGTTLNHHLQREVDEWEQVDSRLGTDGAISNSLAQHGYINETVPTAASTSGVTDERPPWKQFLGDNTPFAFIPGFTPPAGGDILTVDDRLHEKFGRDVNMVDGNQVWEEYEVAAIDRAVANFPDTLADLSLIRNIYRDSDKDPSGPPLAHWVHPLYEGSDYGIHEPESITFFREFSYLETRQGASDSGARVETVIFHELVHSSQFNSDGSCNALTQSYLNEFDWSYDSSGKWHYAGNNSAFPGSSDTFLGGKVGYPQDDRNGLEDMAEAVTYFRYEPETLLRESPERYEWVKNNVFAGQEFR